MCFSFESIMGKEALQKTEEEVVCTLNLLNAIRESWRKSDVFEANYCSAKLGQILDNIKDEDLLMESWQNGMKCPPPENVRDGLQSCYERSKDNNELYQALINAWDVIGCWKSPSQLCAGYCDYFICESSKEPFKDAMILGDKNLGALIESHDLYIGIAYIHPGTTYPSHAHEPSELYHTMVGSACWGPGDRHSQEMQPDSFIFHSSATPHYMKVAEDDVLIAIYCWMGNVTGPYWFLSEKGSSLTKKWSCVRDKLDQTNTEEYFDKMAEDYEEIVRQWGYNLPERVFLTLVDHTEFSKDRTLNILDLGCGDGLFGFVMKNNGFTNVNLTGLDISANMLDKANHRESYSSLVKGNLLEKLPFDNNKFDYVISIATTSYLEPECLQEWLRVVKPGGYIVFTNKTQFSPIWESVQHKLEDDKSWQSVWKSNDMFYMPCCPKEDLSTRVKVLIYRKTTQRMKNPLMSKFGFNFMIGHGQTVPEIETLDETHGR